MSTQPSSGTSQTQDREELHYSHIDCQQWATFFDLFSREHLNVPVTIEVETPEIGSHELARQAPLIGMTANDEHTSQFTIELIVAGSPEGYVSHTVARPTRVTLGPEQIDPRWIEIEAESGEVLTLRWSEREAPASEHTPCAAG